MGQVTIGRSGGYYDLPDEAKRAHTERGITRRTVGTAARRRQMARELGLGGVFGDIWDDALDTAKDAAGDAVEDEARGRGGVGGSPEETALRQAITKVEVWTRLSPPVGVGPREILENNGKKDDSPSAVKELQPTIVLHSPLFGRRIIAPGGQSPRDAWKDAALKYGGLAGGALLLTVGVIFGAGYFVGKRRR